MVDWNQPWNPKSGTLPVTPNRRTFLGSMAAFAGILLPWRWPLPEQRTPTDAPQLLTAPVLPAPVWETAIVKLARPAGIPIEVLDVFLEVLDANCRTDDHVTLDVLQFAGLDVAVQYDQDRHGEGWHYGHETVVKSINGCVLCDSHIRCSVLLQRVPEGWKREVT